MQPAAELQERGYIDVEVNGWIRGRILKVAISSKDQPELPDNNLSRSLIHRQALKKMIDGKLPPSTIRTYWALALQIDLTTGKIHERQIKELSETLSVNAATIYKAIRQLNTIGLAQLDCDYGIRGHLPFVALAFHAVNLLTEASQRDTEKSKRWRDIAKHYIRQLYKAFGIPIDRFTEVELKKRVAELKPLLDKNGENPSLANL